MEMINKAIIVRRFLAKTEERSNGCVEWRGCIQSNGYGRFRLDNKTEYAHRAAYLLFVGSIPPGNDVCHSCDNRKCVNQEHLFVGTRADNMADAVMKGRQAKGEKLGFQCRGERNHNAKLLPDNIRTIIELKRLGCCTKRIASQFGVTTDNVRRIVRRNTWRHVNV
jgi:hypothetical protein